MPKTPEPTEALSDADCIRLGVLPQQLLAELRAAGRCVDDAEHQSGAPGFQFGKTTATHLDRFVRSITRHSPADYASQWSAAAWWQALRMHYTMQRVDHVWSIHQGLLPQWLTDALGDKIWPETDIPAPTLFGVQLATIDWFELDTAHPGELVLLQNYDPAPTIEQIAAAWQLVIEQGGSPRMYATLTPGPELHSPVNVELESFCATWPAPGGPYEASVTRVLGGAAHEHTAPTERFPGQVMASWEWLSCWVETS